MKKRKTTHNNIWDRHSSISIIVLTRMGNYLRVLWMNDKEKFTFSAKKYGIDVNSAVTVMKFAEQLQSKVQRALNASPLSYSCN